MLIKGNLMNSFLLIDVDLVIIIIAYLLVFYGETKAGIFAFGQGFFIDIISVGLFGLFTLLYLVAFLSINLGSRLFDLHTPRGVIILVTLAVLFEKALLLALLNTFSLEITVSSSGFLSFIATALCSGLMAPFLFYVFNHINRFLMREIPEIL